MTAYLSQDIDIHDEEQYDTHCGEAPSFFAMRGGEYVAPGREHDVIEGNWPSARFGLFSFRDWQSVRSLFGDPDCQELKAIRNQAASGHLVALDGLSQ
jgi:uncharacterized protein (DUF1330 family)